MVWVLTQYFAANAEMQCQGAEWMLNMTGSELEELIQPGNQGEINALLDWNARTDSKTLIVPQEFSGTDPVCLLPSPRQRRLWKRPSKPDAVFSLKGGDPGNFIPVFLSHRNCLEQRLQLCVFDLSGRCSDSTAGPFRAKWNVFFDACTCGCDLYLARTRHVGLQVRLAHLCIFFVSSCSFLIQRWQ